MDRTWVRRTLCSLLCLSFAFLMLSIPASAVEAKYHSNVSDEELAKIFSLEGQDIPNAFQWMADSDTFVILEEKPSGKIVYWWNSPNLQMTFYNMLYDQLMISGYGSMVGQDPATRTQWLNIAGDDESAENAMERYGFDLQNPTYMGERPLITISVLGVLLPDNVYDGAGRLFDFIFGGNIVKLPTDDDLSSLMYVAPHDYDVSGATFKTWVDKHWDEIVRASGDGEDEGLSEPGTIGIYKGQILLSTAEDNGYKEGSYWIADCILYQAGLMQEGLDADYICSRLESICGKHYSKVAEGIIIASGIEEVHEYERIMPYDLTRMNSIDVEMFDGIIDPRSEQQENILSTGYGNMVLNVLANWLINWSGDLSELSVFLNNLCTFNALESAGLDPMLLWKNEIVQFLMLCCMLALVFICAKSAVRVVAGNYSMAKLFQRVTITFLLCGLCWGLGSDPEGMYGQFKSISETILNFGNISFEQEDQIQELYGSSEGTDKEAVNLWLPYFNMWTKYHTNHTVLDEEQVIDGSEGPEMEGLVIPDIADVQQNLWSTVLANAASSSNEPYGGNIYRMVDHFMAPRIQLNDAESVDFDVSNNENWNGYIQSNVNWAVLPAQLLILFLVVVKLLLMIELVINVALLLVRMAMTVTDRKNVMTVLKQLLASVANVMVANMVTNAVIWLTLIADGMVLLAITVFMAVLILFGLKELVLSNSVFSPNVIKVPYRFFMRTFGRAWQKIFGSNHGRVDTDIPEEYDPNENPQEEDKKDDEDDEEEEPDEEDNE